MICPACGQRNELGSRRCIECGYPFTRDVLTDERSAAMVGNWQGERARDPRYEPYERPPRRGLMTFLWVLIGLVTVAVVVIIIGLLASNTLLRPLIEDETGDQVGAGIQEAIDDRSSAIPESEAGANGQSGGEEITISEDDINSQIDEDDLGPLDRMNVQINPDGIEVDLRSYGVSGTYRASVEAVDGSVVLRDGSIGGPLGLVMPADEIEASTNQAIAGALSDAGYRVSQVTLQDDALVIVTEDAAGG